MTDNQFTMQDAMNVQAEHMQEWKAKLKKSVYLELAGRVYEANRKGYTNPYQVVRGTEILNILCNMKVD